MTDQIANEQPAQPHEVDKSKGKAARNEAIKLNATFHNAVAIGVIVAGFIIPYLALINGLPDAIDWIEHAIKTGKPEVTRTFLLAFFCKGALLACAVMIAFRTARQGAAHHPQDRGLIRKPRARFLAGRKGQKAASARYCNKAHLFGFNSRTSGELPGVITNAGAASMMICIVVVEIPQRREGHRDFL